MGGLKHIRCFPDHLGGFHKELTFCGTSVDVNVTVPEQNYDKIAVYGEFSESSNISMYIGCQLTKSKVKQYTYPQNGNNNRHFFAATAKKLNEDGSCLYKINNERKGWHYGWLGKRHLVGITHTFNVYVFSVDQNIYTCISIIRSPPFVISCIRKGYRKKQRNLQSVDIISSDEEVSLPHPLCVPAIDKTVGQISPVLTFALSDLPNPVPNKRKIDNIRSTFSSFKEYVPQIYPSSPGYYIRYGVNNYRVVNQTEYNNCYKKPHIHILPKPQAPPSYVV